MIAAVISWKWLDNSRETRILASKLSFCSKINPLVLDHRGLCTRQNVSSQPIAYHIQVNICHNIITLALSFLHSNGIVHRDLSSNNVLLIGNIRTKLADFGMARLAGSSCNTWSCHQHDLSRHWCLHGSKTNPCTQRKLTASHLVSS